MGGASADNSAADGRVMGALSRKQAAFAQEVAKLIQHAYALGYDVTFGEAWRSPQEARRVGMPNSNHTRRMAVDLNLFRNGKYLTSTMDHEVLGTWWERRSKQHRWGGRFGDGNHYSFEHNGVT